MKTTVRNPLLGMVGLSSVLIYVLACTSFSPDDSKVLYPGFDAPSGALGVFSYDRTTGRSECVFLHQGHSHEGDKLAPVLLKPQWTPDGKAVVISWTGTEAMTIAWLPFPAGRPLRMLSLDGLGNSDAQLAQPLPLVGHRVFLACVKDQENEIVRLDLDTGEIKSKQCPAELEWLILLGAPAGDGVYYLAGRGEKTELGKLETDSLKLTPLQALPDKILDKKSTVFALSPDGKKIAVVEREENVSEIRIYQRVAPPTRLAVALQKETLAFGCLLFSPKADRLYATYRSTTENPAGTLYGVMIIPLDGTPPRRVALTGGTELTYDKITINLFKAGLSHDGKTLAVASTYLYFDDKLKLPHVALYLVDVTQTPPVVTKVGIPLPPRGRYTK